MRQASEVRAVLHFSQKNDSSWLMVILPRGLEADITSGSKLVPLLSITGRRRLPLEDTIPQKENLHNQGTPPCVQEK